MLANFPKNSDDFMLPLFLKAKVVQIKETTKKKIKKDDCYIHMPQSLKNLREFNKYNKSFLLFI